MEKEECTELKNIQYQTMLLSGNKLNEAKYSDITNSRIDTFLQKEKELNLNESWNKLDRTVKNKKLLVYSKTYSIKNNLDDDSSENLFIFLKGCLDKKRLLNNKDVLYSKDNQEINDIPSLKYKNNRFCLDRCDKRISTIKSMTPIKTSSLKRNNKSKN